MGRDVTAAFDKLDQQGKHYPVALIHGTVLACLSEEFAIIVTTALLVALAPNLMFEISD
ncbi:MAG: hypothetical protein ACRYFZ_10880 [Janthinobacterium lividum]